MLCPHTCPHIFVLGGVYGASQSPHFFAPYCCRRCLQCLPAVSWLSLARRSSGEWEGGRVGSEMEGASRGVAAPLSHHGGGGVIRYQGLAMMGDHPPSLKCFLPRSAFPLAFFLFSPHPPLPWSSPPPPPPLLLLPGSRDRDSSRQASPSTSTAARRRCGLFRGGAVWRSSCFAPLFLIQVYDLRVPLWGLCVYIVTALASRFPPVLHLVIRLASSPFRACVTRWRQSPLRWTTRSSLRARATPRRRATRPTARCSSPAAWTGSSRWVPGQAGS